MNRNPLVSYLPLQQVCIFIDHTLNYPLGIWERGLRCGNKQAKNHDLGFGQLSINYLILNTHQPLEVFSCHIWVLEIKIIALLASRNNFHYQDEDNSNQFISVAQSCLTLATPWTAACQASMSITNSQSLLKLMSIKPVMPSNHFILFCPLL